MPKLTRLALCIASAALVAFSGCGNSGGDAANNDLTQAEIECANTALDDCHAGTGSCSPARVAPISEEEGCHGTNFVTVACLPTAQCAGGSMIAMDVAAGSPVLLLGCAAPNYDEIASPTEAVLLASQVSCAYINSRTDEECANYGGDDCPSDITNCTVSLGFRYDPQNACVDYDDSTEPECRAVDIDGNNVLAMDPEGGLWEFRPGAVRPSDWPEALDPGFADYGANDSCSD